MKHAPYEIIHTLREDMRKLTLVHEWMTFDEAEILLLHMVDKFYPQKKYNTYETLCDIEFRILQRETESQIRERIRDALAWFE